MLWFECLNVRSITRTTNARYSILDQHDMKIISHEATGGAQVALNHRISALQFKALTLKN